MKFLVKGEGEVSLSKTHFVAQGGEGAVYAKGSTGYKIYHDPTKAIPFGKIQELAGIASPEVIKPEKIVLQATHKKEHVGHTFRFVRDTWTMCQLFPRVFREREGLTAEMIVKLVRKMQGGVDAIHRANVLVVDLNEMNFLVSRDFTTPYFIDVDSYQTPHYPATAIMPSVRDWKTPLGDFTEGSDWWSFAIVTFQMFVGIHPFKGKHPKIKGLDERMKANVSVFDSDVKVPKVCYPYDVIPDVYRAWYKALFVDGKREAPPRDLHGTITVTPIIRTIQGTDSLDLAKLFDFPDSVRAVFDHMGKLVVHVGDTIFMDQRPSGSVQAPIAVGFTAKYNKPIAAWQNGESLSLYSPTDKAEIPVTLRCDGLMAYEGRVYVKTRDKILEMLFTEAGEKVIAGSHIVANVLENASRLYPGVVLQSLLGEPWASVFPNSKTSYQIAIPELTDHKVVDAKYDFGVLMVIAAKGGQYHRFVFRFDNDFKTYDLRKVEDITPTGLNFITLDTGICVCLNEEERLEIFSNRKGSASMKVVEDSVLGGDMTLAKQAGRVVFYRGKSIWKMGTK